MSDYKTWLHELRHTPEFESFKRDVLLEDLPAVPRYVPGDDKTTSQQGDDWVYRSGVQEGYLLALSKFGVRL